MKIIDPLWERINNEREESDTDYFLCLMYLGELLTKLTAVGLLSAVSDDRGSARYGQLHRLVRASGIGEWAQVIDAILTGPTAQFLISTAYTEQRELTARVANDSWQYQALESMNKALDSISGATEPMAERIQGKQWFHAFSALRNRTRGHGAMPNSVVAAICTELHASLHLVVDNFELLNRPWAYLTRNISGKFRVLSISGDCECFHFLRKTNEFEFDNGLYIGFDNDLRRVELVEVNTSITDFYFSNGKFDGTKYELISYTTGDVISASAEPYCHAPGLLPKSETHGLGGLDVLGEALSNVPPQPQDYVDREDLQEQLLELLNDDRHPVITLIGRGGIGKTALTLATIPKLAAGSRFDVIVWFSSRDIDLLPEGPKPVRPDVLSAEDIAREYVYLLDAPERKSKGFDFKEYMNDSLSSATDVCTLFIFDNFETITNIADTYSWLDLQIRNPNKILITTRTRAFRGDYPMEVGGMTEDQCDALIEKIASRYGIADQITGNYRHELFRESGGHPYVVKMLLGGIEPGRPLRSVKRILASQDDILPALFERTFKSLSPIAQRLFLTIASWNSTIPVVALQCILLRDADERIDIDSALSDLERSSLVETTVSSADDNVFVYMSITAQTFGKRQLNVSPYRAAVLADTELLRLFGAGSLSGVKGGVAPHAKRFVRAVAKAVVDKKRKLRDVEQLLYFLARRETTTWLDLADLFVELRPSNWVKKSKDALREYLAAIGNQEGHAAQDETAAWRKLADICQMTSDPVGELNAWIGLVRVPDQVEYEVSNAANHFNNILAKNANHFPKEEKVILANELSSIMVQHFANASATDLSRLAWLFMHLDREEDAKIYAQAGMKKDPENVHCRRLVEKLARR